MNHFLLCVLALLVSTTFAASINKKPKVHQIYALQADINKKSKVTTTAAPEPERYRHAYVDTTLGGAWNLDRKVLIVKVTEPTMFVGSLTKRNRSADDYNDIMVAIHRYSDAGDGLINVGELITRSRRTSDSYVTTEMIELQAGQYVVSGYSLNTLSNDEFAGFEASLQYMSDNEIEAKHDTYTAELMLYFLDEIIISEGTTEELTAGESIYKDTTLYADNGMFVLIEDESDDKYLHYKTNTTFTNCILGRGDSVTYDVIPPKTRQIVVIVSRDIENQSSEFHTSTEVVSSESASLLSDWSGGVESIQHRPALGNNEDLFKP